MNYCMSRNGTYACHLPIGHNGYHITLATFGDSINRLTWETPHSPIHSVTVYA